MPRYRKNKLHVGGGITMRVPVGFRHGLRHGSGAGFAEFRCSRQGHVLIGSLYYGDGIVEFTAPLLGGEQDELNRVIESVARRADLYLADTLERRKSWKKRQSRKSKAEQ